MVVPRERMVHRVNPRVLHLVTRADLAGAQRYVLLCASHSPQDAIIGVGADGPLISEAERLGCRWEIIPGLSRGIAPLQALASVRATVAAIRRLAPDVVHTHTSNAGLVGRLAAALTGTPVVHTVHGWQFFAGNRWPVRAASLLSEWLMMPLSDVVICVCAADADLARRLQFPCSERLAVVLNAVADRQPQRRPGSRLRIGMVARFVWQKDHATLLQALRWLPEVECHLWGDGPERRSCELMASDLPRVVFHGEQPDVPSLLGTIDVLVLTTKYEGLPLSLLEGMAAGLPLIATAVNGVPEVVRHRWNGFLVRPRDPVEVAEAIRAYQQTPYLLIEHGRNSRRWFEQAFTAKRFHQELASVYERALGCWQPAPSCTATLPSSSVIT